MMQHILYRQKRQVRSGLERQLQAASLGFGCMKQDHFRKGNNNLNCQENTHHMEPKT
jgi:hypothetical protein